MYLRDVLDVFEVYLGDLAFKRCVYEKLKLRLVLGAL